MKSIKLFRVAIAKADAVYSIFKSCNVFTVILDGEIIPVYDFSGNALRSTLNSLRKFFPEARVGFYCKSCFADDFDLPIPYHGSRSNTSTLPLPYSLRSDNCYLYF